MIYLTPMYDHLVNIYSTRTVALFIGTQPDFYRQRLVGVLQTRLAFAHHPNFGVSFKTI